MKAVLSLDMKLLSDLFDAQGQRHLIFSAREVAQQNELVDLLEPFLEATSVTEGEDVVTITFALPSVLSLINHLQNSRQQLKYCGTIADALLASMKQRFDGILQRVQVAKADRVPDISSLSYGSDIYIISAFFDPKFRLQWIDHELQLSDEHKEGLKNEITGTVVGVTL
jgi:hypothetical protein